MQQPGLLTVTCMLLTVWGCSPPVPETPEAQEAADEAAAVPKPAPDAQPTARWHDLPSCYPDLRSATGGYLAPGLTEPARQAAAAQEWVQQTLPAQARWLAAHPPALWTSLQEHLPQVQPISNFWWGRQQGEDPAAPVPVTGDFNCDQQPDFVVFGLPSHCFLSLAIATSDPLAPRDAALAQHELSEHLVRKSHSASDAWLALSDGAGGWSWRTLRLAYAANAGTVPAWLGQAGGRCPPAGGILDEHPALGAAAARGCTVLYTGCCERSADDDWLLWNFEAGALRSVRDLPGFAEQCLPQGG